MLGLRIVKTSEWQKLKEAQAVIREQQAIIARLKTMLNWCRKEHKDDGGDTH